MRDVGRIPPAVGGLGSLICSLIIAVEFGGGFHLRGLSMNLALGFAWLLVMAFAVASYRAHGLWSLLSVPIGVYVLTSPGMQIAVACSVNAQLCP